MPIRYHIDSITSSSIRGWGLEENSTAPITVTIDEVDISMNVARPDVYEKFGGALFCGFVYKIPAQAEIVKIVFSSRFDSLLIYVHVSSLSLTKVEGLVRVAHGLKGLPIEVSKKFLSSINANQIDERLPDFLDANSFSSQQDIEEFWASNHQFHKKSEATIEIKDKLQKLLELQRPEDDLKVYENLLKSYMSILGKDEFFYSKLTLFTLKSEKYLETIQLCEAALSEFPLSADLWWHHSIGKEKILDFEGALKSKLASSMIHTTANRMLSSGQLAIRAVHGDYGVVPGNSANFAHAQLFLEKAIELGRSDGLPEYELSRLLFHKRRIQESLVYINAALQKCENRDRCLVFKSSLLFFCGEVDQAREIIQFASQTDQTVFLNNVYSNFRAWGFRENIDELFDTNASDAEDSIDLQYINFNIAVISDKRKNTNRVRTHLKSVNVNKINELQISRDNLRKFKFRTVSKEKKVWLVSRFGRHGFGGAERFLQHSQKIYEEMGYRVRYVAFSKPPESHLNSSEMHEYSDIFLSREPGIIFQAMVDDMPEIIHSVSGSCYEIASAARGLRIFHIHGLHFWRDFLYSDWLPDGHTFSNPERLETRSEFSNILAGNGVVYANSLYTAQFLHDRFGVFPPVIPSLPIEVSEQLSSHPATSFSKSYVLLMNSRANKGSFFTLQIASMLPSYQFVIVASQSDKEIIFQEVLNRSLKNVSVVDRVEDPSALYRDCKIVLVPSFDFVETFSRVVIEAHRFGKPVIGANVGNVAKLLDPLKCALPKNHVAWADEIMRLYENEEYYNQKCKQAAENSRDWPESMFSDALQKVISSEATRILVCVGTGLGNMLQTTPLISRISRFFKSPVDILIAGDSTNAYQIFAQNEHVCSIFSVSEVPLARFYDHVVVTNSFGGLELPWCASRVFNLKDAAQFDPGGVLHEADHNIKALGGFIRISENPASDGEFFFGNLPKRTSGRNGIIGIHAGSKGGKWACKQWSKYRELSVRLEKQGYLVRSFGAKSEYIEGCYDFCGLDLTLSAEAILDCDVFVSNDSGFMNIASALCVPQVALFGPTNPITRGPKNRKSVVVQDGSACSPCEVIDKEFFNSGECCCIDKISVDVVVAAIENLYKEHYND